MAANFICVSVPGDIVVNKAVRRGNHGGEPPPVGTREIIAAHPVEMPDSFPHKKRIPGLNSPLELGNTSFSLLGRHRAG